MRTSLLGAGLALACAVAGPTLVRGEPRPSRGERHLTLFYTGDVRGTLEPCGCNSDPLGDVARYAALVRAAAHSGPTLLADGGGLSYPESASAKEKAANDLRAKFLGKTLQALGPFAAGLAENDLGAGRGEVTPRRLAVNFSKSPAIVPSELKTIGDVRVGIFGVADPALAARLGAQAEDPVPAAQRGGRAGDRARPTRPPDGAAAGARGSARSRRPRTAGRQRPGPGRAGRVDVPRRRGRRAGAGRTDRLRSPRYRRADRRRRARRGGVAAGRDRRRGGAPRRRAQGVVLVVERRG